MSSPTASTQFPKTDRPGLTVWLYGLSGSGKSTLSRTAASRLALWGRSVTLLDGDILRAGLNRDLGFSEADRTENLRRAAEVARLLTHQGQLVLCAFITPLARQRAMVRAIVGTEALQEVYLSADVEACARRDPKGLYAKARGGRLAQFTGVGAEFEPPTAEEHPLVLDTGHEPVEACLERLLAKVGERTGQA